VLKVWIVGSLGLRSCIWLAVHERRRARRQVEEQAQERRWATKPVSLFFEESEVVAK